MRILKNLFLASFMLAMFASCQDNLALVATDETTDENGDVVKTEYDATINIIENSNESKTEATVNMGTKTTAKVRVTFASEEGKFRRLYITENIAGEGAHPYELQLKDGVKVDTKGDGSIDLQSKYKKGFDFAFDITPEQLEKGSVEYKFWATNDRGDFRNPDFKGILGGERRVAEIGTITLKFGTAANEAKMKSFEAVLLSAPLADGTSKSFISLFDGKTYKINEGAEMAAFWDFGYFYGDTYKACLYSTSNYPKSGFSEEYSNILKDNKVNVTKFKLSTKTGAFFTDVNVEQLAELDASNITKESVTKLNVGDIIEFVDNYGKKGLIKVIEISEGMGSRGKIKIHIKMQA